MDKHNLFFESADFVTANNLTNGTLSKIPVILIGMGIYTAQRTGVSPIVGAVVGGAVGGLIVGIAEVSTDFNKK